MSLMTSGEEGEWGGQSGPGALGYFISINQQPFHSWRRRQSQRRQETLETQY